jgi:hypothetical protein
MIPQRMHGWPARKTRMVMGTLRSGSQMRY